MSDFHSYMNDIVPGFARDAYQAASWDPEKEERNLGKRMLRKSSNSVMNYMRWLKGILNAWKK